MNIRHHVKDAARRVRFLLPPCRHKRRLAQLLDAARGTLDCDKTIGGRTRALLARLNAIQEALARPHCVHPRDRVPAHDPTVDTQILGLLRSLTTEVDGVADPTRAHRRSHLEIPRSRGAL